MAARPPKAFRSRQVIYPTDGAIGIFNHSAVLTKETAGAYTIGAPTRDGLVITVLNVAGVAHTLTTPTDTLRGQGAVLNGTGNTLTLFLSPAPIKLESYGGKWYCDCNKDYTGTVSAV